jgi:transposase
MSQGSTTSKQPLIRYVNRKQMSWRAVDVEHLIGEDHPARAIGALVGRLDLRAFYGAIESSVEEGGRPAFDPQLLISLWVYAYSQGIASAREVARRCEYDPAFQWLTGLAEVNDHTLADFRVEKQQELDELFTQVLAALSKEGLITLEQEMQDGTKIKAQASRRSYLPEETIREHLERARRRVAEMGDPRNDESSPKAKKARARARREQQERLEGALEELEKWQARKSGENAKRETRVSTSDPQARVMKHPDKGFVLSDNAQISTDAAHGLMVGLAVTQEANDSAQLLPAVDRVEQRLEKKPQQMVADSGYTTRENIEKLAGREVDFLGTMRQEDVPRGANLKNRFPPSAFLYQPERNRCVCPEGQVLLPQARRQAGAGMIYHLYEARFEDCRSGPRKPECCPDNQKNGRSVAQLEESPVVMAFRKKMASEEVQERYRRRGRIVEFCHAWIKSKLGLRQFHVRGLKKVQMEMLWACLTYNLQFWIRLSKLRTTPAVT